MRFREFLAEWFLTGVAIVSGLFLVTMMALVLYGVYSGQHPTDLPTYYNKGPQDPQGTH
jgi:hypothetical protein